MVSSSSGIRAFGAASLRRLESECLRIPDSILRR